MDARDECEPCDCLKPESQVAASTESICVVGRVSDALKVEVEVAPPLKGPWHRLNGCDFPRHDVACEKKEAADRDGAPPEHVGGGVEMV